ncbi:helix-turn-helix transcriptional regulator [Streptomyces minutiscleroticus]
MIPRPPSPRTELRSRVLASRSGLARRTLIDLEHGRTTGSVTTWHALAHTFDVSIEHFLGALCDDHTPSGRQDSPPPPASS